MHTHITSKRLAVLCALGAAALLPASGARAYVFGDPIVTAQGKMVLDVNARVRIEARDNAFDFNDSATTTNDDTLVLTRLRLGAKYKVSDTLSFYAQLQDAREFDSKRPNVPYANAAEGDDIADVRQLYFDIGDPRDNLVTARIGRQMMAYGDERLIGGFEWNNLARTFDAAKVTLNLADIRTTVDAFVGSVVQSKTRKVGDEHDFDFNTSDAHDIFAGAYLTNKGAIPNQISELYLLYRGKTRNGPIYRPNTQSSGATGVAPWDIPEKIFTLGFRAASVSPAKLKGFDYTVEGALQWGKARPGLSAAVSEVPDWYDHSAYAFHAETGYTWDKSPLAPRVGIEYNVASGDTDPTDTRNEGFLNLFHTNHKFFGFMDAMGWKNMRSVAITGKLKPLYWMDHSLKKSILRLDCHWLALKTTQDLWYRANAITPVINPATSMRASLPRDVGVELDATWTWSPSPPYAFLVGYSKFLTGDYLPAARAVNGVLGKGDNASFLYVQTMVKF